MGQGMIRVDRGDGKLLQFQPNDVDAFLKATPGAKRVATPVPSGALSAAEQAATAALGSVDDVDNMTVAQLKTYAEAHDIDLSGASVKADILERIKANEGEASEDNEGD